MKGGQRNEAFLARAGDAIENDPLRAFAAQAPQCATSRYLCVTKTIDEKSMPYKVYAALAEDINSGWVWVAHPEVTSRTVVRIVNQSNGKDIYCEALAIEPNFVSTYDSAGGTCPIKDAANAIVINAWYRMRLGDISTQSSYDLTISPAENICGRMRACLQHPQVVVRLSSWLAMLGLFLGIVAVGLGVLPFLLTRQ